MSDQDADLAKELSAGLNDASVFGPLTSPWFVTRGGTTKPTAILQLGVMLLIIGSDRNLLGGKINGSEIVTADGRGQVSPDLRTITWSWGNTWHR